MNNRIYIAGRITGAGDYREKFAKAEEKAGGLGFYREHGGDCYVRTGAVRYETVNPCRVLLWGKGLGAYPWRVAMAVCLWKLAGCSTVYMLRDWTESRGARMENTLAQLLGKRIIYEENETRQPSTAAGR